MPPIDAKIKKRAQIVLAVLVVAALGLQLWKWRWPEATVEIAGQEKKVLVAKTLYQRHKGLGGRDNLAPYDGMIFLFDLPGRYPFVMRDMRFSLDIIWLRDGAVVDIASNLPPEAGVPEEKLTLYYPRADANLVLEAPAGWAAAAGVKIGDKLTVANK